MTNQPRNIQLLLWWVLWGSFMVGVFVIYFALRPASIESRLPGSPTLWPVGVVPTFASILVRWVLLPRLSDPRAALASFLIGLSLAEAPCYLALFWFRVYQDQFFVLSALGIAQFMPLYAGRYRSPDE